MLDIVYEDADLLAVNKPSGVLVHPDANHETGTLIQEIAKIHPEIADVGEDPTRPGVVHRLDRDTSGLLLVARNQSSFQYLKELFQNKTIQKTYLVLVSGLVKKDEAVIDLPIGRSRKHPLRRVSGKGASGKIREAVTRYRVRERFRGVSLDGVPAAANFTLLEAMPLTGRTHQIRSHFAALGYPVVCDRLYGGKQPVCPAGLSRQFLHAWRLELLSPSAATLRLEADLPPDLANALEQLRNAANHATT